MGDSTHHFMGIEWICFCVCMYMYIYIYHYVCACVFQYFNIIHINDYVFYDMKYSKLRIYPKASLYNGN